VIKRIGLLMVAALMAVMMMAATAVPAFAANAPAGCDKVRGTIICEESGKNENQPKFQQTTTKKGSVNSSHDPVVTCSTPCPPGQFKD
jgi:hypothetical protein